MIELLLALFVGMLLQWGFTALFSKPLCKECGAKAMPNTTTALVRAHHRIEKLEVSLRRLYDDTADYIILNNLGDVHHNKPMQMAREALRGSPSAASGEGGKQ